jgi:hypothetical protein
VRLPINPQTTIGDQWLSILASTLPSKISDIPKSPFSVMLLRRLLGTFDKGHL